MQCLNPITITSRKRHLGFGDYFLTKLPCGKCANCRKMKQQAYYSRAFATYHEAIDNGGYMYFDTLTYSNENLPHISDSLPVDSSNDFSCFSTEHYRLFMKRLRRRLAYHGFKNSNCFKYFLSCEYGGRNEYTDERGNKRVGTMRPHYHVLFFVMDPNLSPAVFSRAVSDAWQYGRTDGIPYKDLGYILEHTYGPDYNNNPEHEQNVCYYVAKYVTKDYDLDDVLSDRLEKVESALSLHEGFENRDDISRTLASTKRAVEPFTRQSNGFGLYAIDPNFFVYRLDPSAYDVLLTEGSLKIPCNIKDADHDGYRHIPAPMYLYRKLFQECKKGEDGRLRWLYTEEGMQFKLRRMLKGVDALALNMESWYKYECDSDEKKLISSYLNGRTWKDFATYQRFYRGRVIDRSTTEMPSVKRMCELIANQEQNVYNSYNTETDYRLFGRKFVDMEPFSPNFVNFFNKYEIPYKQYNPITGEYLESTRTVEGEISDDLCVDMVRIVDKSKTYECYEVDPNNPNSVVISRTSHWQEEEKLDFATAVNLSRAKECREYHKTYVNLRNLGLSHEEAKKRAEEHNAKKDRKRRDTLVSIERFAMNECYNQNSYPEWNGFDNIDLMYHKYQSALNKRAEECHRFIEDMKKRRKMLGIPKKRSAKKPIFE